MNISDINRNIYGHKNLKEGENIDFIMKSIEKQEIESFNFLNFKKNEKNSFKEINKEIKF